MKAPEIITEPPCAVDVAAGTGHVTQVQARDIFKALIKAGFIVAPLEPTNSMFGAYIGALGQVPTNPATVVSNIGKARKRWKAMASIGMSVVFSKERQLVPAAGAAPASPAPQTGVLLLNETG